MDDLASTKVVSNSVAVRRVEVRGQLVAAAVGVRVGCLCEVQHTDEYTKEQSSAQRPTGRYQTHTASQCIVEKVLAQKKKQKRIKQPPYHDGGAHAPPSPQTPSPPPTPLDPSTHPSSAMAGTSSTSAGLGRYNLRRRRGRGGQGAVGGRVPPGSSAPAPERVPGLSPLHDLLEGDPDFFMQEVLGRLADPADLAVVAQVGRQWRAAVLASGRKRAGSRGAVTLKLADFVGSEVTWCWLNRRSPC